MVSPDDARLRVLLVTEDDPLYVIRFFETFLDEYPPDEFELVGLTVDDAFHEPIWKTARRMLRFYGPVGFLRLCWRFLKARLSRRSIERLVVSRGVPSVPAKSVNDPDYIQRVRELSPDVIVSVAAPEIFRESVLGAARLGCVNIHSGRLPVYRGMMPNFWQLKRGEKAAEVTVHEMAPKLDAGRVLGTLSFPLKERDTLDRVIVGTKREGARLMIDVLRKLREGTVEPREVDMAEASYFSFPTPADVREFRARGHRLL